MRVFHSLDEIRSPFPEAIEEPAEPTVVEGPKKARGTDRIVAEDPRIGSVIAGRYRILSRIAVGGMGIVYKGLRLGLARPVAIKFLRSHAMHDESAVARFRIEAKAASKLSHPNCVAVTDGGLEDGEPFIVMDFIEGQTLREVMNAGPLAVPRALSIVSQVLAGLAHAHHRGVIHRDIKPDNIFVWNDAGYERATIGDFGLAKCADVLGISQDVLVGTPNYMAPEQTTGAPVDARADVYAVGILLFELLTTRKPFSAKNIFDTMKQHREARVPAFDEVAPDRVVPPGVEGVVRAALMKNPAMRPPSAAALAALLADAMTEAKAESDVEVKTLLRATSSRWRLRAMLLAMLAGSVGLAAATYL
ncbi:MAG TPA: serine/threonine-protein kinase [Kofleriaceae bacterium]|jgi:serine/threonine-protein kinase